MLFSTLIRSENNLKEDEKEEIKTLEMRKNTNTGNIIGFKSLNN